MVPVAVHLEFAPPAEQSLAVLHVWEAPSKTGPWSEIDSTPNVGTYPSYINHYTTQQASSALDWFAIQWEDDRGALGSLSEPVQGDTTSLVYKIVQRVSQRDTNLDRAVITQEAEAAIEKWSGSDPYTVDPDQSYQVINGLVYLSLARALLLDYVTKQLSASSVSIGLVKVSNSTGQSQQYAMRNIQGLVDLANRELGIATSIVLLLQDMPVGISRSAIDNDKSRLAITVYEDAIR